MEELALKILLAIARTRLAVLLLTLLVDGQDEVNDLVAYISRQAHERRAGILDPRGTKAGGEEGLDICKSIKSAFDMLDFGVDGDTRAGLPLQEQPPSSAWPQTPGLQLSWEEHSVAS